MRAITHKIAASAIRFKLKYTRSLHGGQQIAQVLKSHRVSHLFTLCGGHIAPIYLSCAEEGIKVIDFRHEQAATHCADAWGRLTRHIGVAVVTAGPGVTDCITGIANAYYANSPLLVLAGKSPLNEQGQGSLQEMEQLKLVESITKWAQTVTDPLQLARVTDQAIRIALEPPMGPVYLDVPVDVLMEMSAPKKVIVTQYNEPEPETENDPDLILKCSESIRQSERLVLFAGSDIWWDDAVVELQALVEKSDGAVFLNGMGRGCLPADHPHFYRYVRRQAFKLADLIVILGTPLDFRLNFGQFGSKARVIYINRSSLPASQTDRAGLVLTGDLKTILTQLLETIGDQKDLTAWHQRLGREEIKKRTSLDKLGASSAIPISHYRLCAEIARMVDSNTHIIGDGGDIVAVGSKVIPASYPQQWMDPGPFGCLGVGPSFAIAAQLLNPQKRVLILHGDGSFGLNGMEFDTAVRFNLPIVSIVGNDAGWGQIRNPQIAILGEKATTATDLAPARYDEVVKALGGHGELVTEPSQIYPALRRAFEASKPACVNVMLDPDTLKGGVNLMRGLSI